LIWPGIRLFLVYAVNFVHFNVLYGTLGGIVAILLWLYLSSCVGVLGACCCAAQAEIRGLPPPHSCNYQPDDPGHRGSPRK